MMTYNQSRAYRSKVNMRSVLLGCVLAASSMSLHAAPVAVDTSAFGTDGDSQFGVGFTTSITTRPYTDADPLVAGLPFFTANKNGFYINGVTVGYELTADPDPFVAPELSLRIDILALPRFLGYKVEESPVVLEGLDDIDYTIHGGVSFSLINGPANFNVQLLTDLLGISGGSEINGTVSKTFTLDKLSLTPAFTLNWQDEALVDFYYGINASEATATRSQYSAGSTINAAASLTAGYPITPKLSTFGALRFEQLGSEIADSPIVSEETVSSITAGLVYTFSAN